MFRFNTLTLLIFMLSLFSCSFPVTKKSSQAYLARYEMTGGSDSVINMNLSGKEMAGSQFSNRYFLNFEGASISPSESFIRVV